MRGFSEFQTLSFHGQLANLEVSRVAHDPVVEALGTSREAIRALVSLVIAHHDTQLGSEWEGARVDIALLVGLRRSKRASFCALDGILEPHLDAAHAFPVGIDDAKS